MKLFLVSIIVFFLNIPFGYWRANVKKFSLQWALAIHLPIPVIVLLRIYTGIGFAWYTYVFLVTAFFTGQKTGAIIHNAVLKKYTHASSNIIRDLFSIKDR